MNIDICVSIGYMYLDIDTCPCLPVVNKNGDYFTCVIVRRKYEKFSIYTMGKMYFRNKRKFVLIWGTRNKIHLRHRNSSCCTPDSKIDFGFELGALTSFGMCKLM